MSAFFSPLINKHYLYMCSKCQGKPPAEYRLIPMMCSCWFIPIGLFIFGWTSYPRIHWFGPAIGGWPVGFGFIFLYNSANNYLGKSFVRSWLVSGLYSNRCKIYSGHLSTPSCFCAGCKDIPAIHVGRWRRAVHRTDVPPSRLPMGQFLACLHWSRLLPYPLCLLVQGCSYPQTLSLRLW